MQISFFINRPPPFVGGLQNVCWRVAKHFQESVGARVRIIGFPDRDNSSSSEEELAWEHEGVEVQELRRGWREALLLRWVPFLKKRWATFPLAVACYEWAYSQQISRLCHGSSVFHYFGTGMEMNGYPVARAARKIGAKLVIEPAIHEGTWGDTWLDTPLYRKADLLLAHTDFEAGIIQNLGIPNSKIRTIVHGVDFCDSGDGGRFRGMHGIAGPMVLFLGRKTREKGVGRLLEAWPMVAEKFPEATLVIAGPKSALGSLEDIRWKIEDRWAEGTTEGAAHLTTGLPGASRLTTDFQEEPRITQIDTDKSREAGPCLDKPSGASESDLLTSELADSPVSESLIRSADGPASVRLAPGGVGSDGGNQLADSGEFLEGQSQAGLQMDSQKHPPPRAAMGTDTSGKNSSSVSISVISGKINSDEPEALSPATSHSLRVTAPRARVLNLDDLAEGEKQDALAACDILCVPSEGESFGMVYFEAWAYKKPVVALDLPVLQETIGRHGGGLLCKPEPSDIAESLIQLLGNSVLRSNLGERGNAVAIEHDWPRALESYSIAYQSLGS